MHANSVNSVAMNAPQLCDRGLLRGAAGLLVAAVLLFGVAYPLVGVGLGQALFPAQANGSLIEQDGQVLGSALLAQPFVSDAYFQPRPSAVGYQTMAAGGSNLARSNPELRAQIHTKQQALAARYGVAAEDIPSDLITASGSGLDPDISPEAAGIQLARVAQARGLEPAVLAQWLQAHTQAKQWGVMGQPRVNVLELNLALDAMAPLLPRVAQQAQ